MRFFIDQGVSPKIAGLLIEAGHEAVHAKDLGMSGAKDVEIVELAEQTDRVIITEDTDFGGLLVPAAKNKPSVILFRNASARSTVRAKLLLQNLEAVKADLLVGAIVVVEDASVRVRRLGEQTDPANE